MAEDGLERTERPTPKRREEARRHGQVAQSPEVAPVAVLLAGLVLATSGAPRLLDGSRRVLRAWLADVGPMAVGRDSAWPALARSALDLGGLLVPFFAGVALVGAGAIVAQVGWRVTPRLVAPDVERLSPTRNLERIFSVGGAMNLVKALVKITVVLTVAYHVVRGAIASALGATAMAPADILGLTGASLAHLFLVMAVALGVLGALDYAWQRRRHEQSLRMTRQEVKQEARETEGDPQIRGRFRKAHRTLARRRMLADVARADVVLTNPVHVAVALRYEAAEMAAPRVLAKGAGDLAQRIKDAARAAGVPIVERRALARALFRTVEIGAEIPPTLYRAVAEILAYIYSLRGARRAEVR